MISVPGMGIFCRVGMTAWTGSFSTPIPRWATTREVSGRGRRWQGGSDEELDNAHLMRMAGRFSRRVKAWGEANRVPVIHTKKGERKHRIAESYLADHEVGPGVFLVLVAKAPATVWKVTRSTGSVIVNLEKKTNYVNHCSFHIMDPEWGHVTVKMSGHPPFGAQVILNGHEYVACAAQAEGIGFVKEGNCFTAVADPSGLAQVADTLSHPAAAGRLSQVCNRWIYTACLCFGLARLDSDQQAHSAFRYQYSVYQVEYSRNLMFHNGAQMDKIPGGGGPDPRPDGHTPAADHIRCQTATPP
ncbi:MAG TPA: hypothetical protein VE569_11455 [Acidimicrobiia bacterium]|nr:hypothetical protein [Acidimicrobiia bacterium]